MLGEHDRGRMRPGFKQAVFFPEQRVEMFSLVRPDAAKDDELVTGRYDVGRIELQAA